MRTVPDAAAADAAAAGDTAGDEPVPAPFHLPLSPLGADRVRPWTVATVITSATVLAAASAGGFGPLLGATLALALVLAWAWPVLAGSFTPVTTSIVLLAAAPGIVLSALRDDLRWTAAAVAFGIVVAFMGQLVRTSGRAGLVLTLLASFGGLLPMTSATLAVTAGDESLGRAYVVVTMAAAAAAVLADLLAGRRRLSPLLGLVALGAAVAGGVVAALLLDELGAWTAVGLAAAAGSLSWSFRRVLALQPAMLGVRGQVAAGLGSVLVLGVLVRLFLLVS
ncbi:hypothetical protein [Intrasporangium calvum]|uniref:hypothetical protein n=1 Tax=Intrasporangium calvum TaxID=53358 RepID=UPI000DF5DBBD|nr:hypothetical protein [Intrasporangium calvum]AXG14364.1 hypothetical protein DN585_13965 [Intrasporangium calvum]